MAWLIQDSMRIFGSTMVKMNLLGVPITLTGSNRSGFLLNAFWLVKFKGISRKTCPSIVAHK